VEWVPEDQQPIRRGQPRVLHGHQIPGKQLPKYHAAKVADLYGAPGLTVVFGHAHRPQHFERPSKEGAVARTIPSG
jgi:predicted phosphodiesterase